MAGAARRLASVAARPKIIAPYERVSAIMGREDEAFRSPDLQRRATLDVIARAGAVPFPEAIEHPERFRDIDRTGRDFHREGIQRLLDLKRAGVIDGIAVLDVSRVGRTTSETLAVIDVFRSGEHGTFLSARENIDDTPQGEWMLTNFVAMAQLYSDNMALGWRAAIEARAESGEQHGPAPVGYKREKLDSGRTRVVVDPVTAPLIVDAFSRYAAGASATSIELGLQRAGVVSAKSFGVLKRRILANPFYVGDVRLWAYAGKAKQRVKLRDVEPFITRGVHEPLLLTPAGEPDRDLFEKVQQRLAEDKRRAPRYVDPVHALGGLVRCAGCGFAATYFANAGRGNAHYRCKRRHGNGDEHCVGCGSAAVAEVESLVRATVREHARGWLVADGTQAAGTLTRRRQAATDREAIEREIAAVQTKITRVDDDYYGGTLPRERHARLVAQYDAELGRAQAALDAIGPVVEAPPVEQLVSAAQRLDELWDVMTPSERNAALRACGVERVTIRKGTRWREPVVERIAVRFSI